MPWHCAAASPQAVDSQVHPSIVRELASSTLQLLRAHTRYARWALVRPPSTFNPEQHNRPGRVLTDILRMMQAAASAIAGTCRRAASAAAGKARVHAQV